MHVLCVPQAHGCHAIQDLQFSGVGLTEVFNCSSLRELKLENCAFTRKTAFLPSAAAEWPGELQRLHVVRTEDNLVYRPRDEVDTPFNFNQSPDDSVYCEVGDSLQEMIIELANFTQLANLRIGTGGDPSALRVLRWHGYGLQSIRVGDAPVTTGCIDMD